MTRKTERRDEVLITTSTPTPHPPPVQPDSDFECIAVMLEHTQDVKCLAWHPSEEVSPDLVLLPSETSTR